jgi:UDP-GlcNAc:undecaprenyl-phosphate GlcNAc-1-phosphate transferase
MGDCGSMLIGFTLALLTLNYADVDAANRLRAITVPIMILMVPIFDTTLVTLIRTLSGRKASVGGKDHTSHRLVLMGLSEKNAVLFLYGIAAVSGLSALFVDRSDTLTSPAAIIPLVLSFLLLGIYLAQLRIYPEKEFSMLRDKSYTPVLVELTYKRQMLLVFLDFFLIAFAYYLSYRLRFDADEFAHFFRFFLRSLPAVIACKFIAFFTMGIYRGIWRYMSSDDVFVYLKASTLASFLAITFVAFVYRFEGSSKGVLLIDWFLTTGLLIGTRGSFKLFVDTIKRKGLQGDNVIIYGAGRGGEILLREILNNDRLNLKPIGFIDDDELKTGKKLQGFPILGTLADLDRINDKHRPDGLLISFTPQAADKLLTTRQYCRQNGLFLKQFAVSIETVDLEDRSESYPSTE